MQTAGTSSRITSHPFGNNASTSRRKHCRQHIAPRATSGNVDDEDRQQGGFASFLSALKPNAPSGTQRLTRPSGAAEDKPGFFSFFAPMPATSRSGGRGDAGTVFVAGSTGRLGIRIVRELAAAGLRVRAGVRSQEKAENFEEILAQLGETVGPLSRQDAGRVKVVYCDLEDPDTIAPAIGNASRVVCAVGAAENEFTDFSAPRRIDYEATERLIETAAELGTVKQFVLVTSLGTGKFGLPAGVLNLFGGVLIWKRRAEQALERSGLPYLIVRPGGMERPKDDYKLTHNVRLAPRDSLFGGTISRLQVAELIAAAVASPELAENKTVEVVAETKAPALEYEMLLAGQGSEVDQEQREAEVALAQETRTQLAAARQGLDAATSRLAELTTAAAAAAEVAAEARAAAKEAEKEQGGAIKSAQRMESQLNKLRAEAEEKAALAAAAKAVATEAQKAQREARMLTDQEIAAIKDSVLNPPVEDEEEEDSSADLAKKEAAPALMGVFKTFGTQRKAVATPAASAAEKATETAPTKSTSAGKTPAADPMAMFGAFFTPTSKAAAVQEEDEAADEQVEEEPQQPVPASAAPEAPTGLFAGFASLFQPQEAVYIDELELDQLKQQQQAEEAAAENTGKSDSAKKPSSRPSVRELRAAAAAAAESSAQVEEEAGVDTAEEEAKPVAKGPMFQMPGLFAGFSKKIETAIEQLGDEAAAERQRTSDAAEEAQRRAEAAAAEEAARKQQETEAAAAARAAEEETARAKRASEEEAARKQQEAEKEAAAAAKAAEEEAARAKRASEEEEARTRQEMEAAAAAATATAAAPAAESASPGSENPMANMFGSIKLPWQQENQEKQVAPAQEISQAAVSDVGGAAVDNAAEARAWIEAWRSRASVDASSESNGVAAPQGAAPASEDVPANVAEAREWIATWRSRT